nr:MAG TPA: intron associated endonuclease [Caudoviricetes sp.]
MMEKIFYVYKHTFPNGKVYIGITSQEPKSRWGCNGIGYNHQPRVCNAIKKYGWDNIRHEVIYSKLTHDEACAKEVELISKYNSTNKQFGYNNTIGGECLLGEDNPFYGKIHTIEAKKKMSKAKKGVPLKREIVEKIRLANTGKVRDENFKEKMREIGKRVNKTGYQSRFARPIYQIDLDTSKIIKQWGSIIDAANFYNISYPTICAACQGKIRQSVGFKWQYVDEPHEYVEKEKHYKTCHVEKYTKDGKFVARFNSVKEAVESVGKNSTSAISRACKGKTKTAYGFIWRYAHENV